MNSFALHVTESDTGNPCTEQESSERQAVSNRDEKTSDDGFQCLSRGQQLWFSQVTREYEDSVLSAYRSVSRRVDLVEICAPWDSPLSQAVIDAGGKAERWGCHNGFDLSTKSGCVEASHETIEASPTQVCSCFPSM